MSIIAITIQPDEESINAAYRPVVLRVQADSLAGGPIPPVVYCDIYFAGVFYKTISKTQYELANDTYSEWQFDIQDACQEYLGKYLGQNGGTALELAAPLIVETYCMFRSSGIDDDGFIQYEGTEPIQGTDSSDPVAGDGTESNDFAVLNSTLQHEDNQVFTAHLASYKTGTWNANTYPLSHRPGCYMGIGQSDFFPIVTTASFGDCSSGSLVIKYKIAGDLPSDAYRSETAVIGDVSCDGEVSDVNVEIDGSNATITWTGSGDIVNYSYSLDGGAEIEVDVAEIDLIDLAEGAHTIVITPNCTCSSGEGVETDFDIEAPTCINVSIAGGQTIPDANIGEAYLATINLTGTAPFVLGAVSGPIWMTIEIVGNTIQFSGNPITVATDVPVSAEVTNCSDGDVTFEQDIDVISTASTITFDYRLGMWRATLNGAVSSDLSINNMNAFGYTDSGCSVSSEESDLLETPFVLAAGDLTATDLTNGLTSASTFYHIENTVDINGVNYNNGETFVIDGVTITIIINNISCAHYEA